MVAEIKLPPDITQRILVLVSDGDYPDAESAIREAVQLLEDQVELDRFKQSLEDSRRAHAEGRSSPFDDDAMNRIWASANEKIRTGAIPKPDVCPEWE